MKKGDKFILLAILLCAALLEGCLVLPGLLSPQTALTARIQTPAGTRSISLSQLQQPQCWTLQGAMSEVELCYEPERGLYIAHSSCPDQVCVSTGAISQPGQSLVCVPNEIMITLVGQGSGKEDPDVILR